jgi:hypothetical protein
MPTEKPNTAPEVKQATHVLLRAVAGLRSFQHPGNSQMP